MERHIKSRPKDTYQEIVPGGTMRFLDFARLQLAAGERHSLQTNGREAVLDIFSGRISVTVEYREGKAVYSRAGDRADVFDGPPVVIYIPPHARYEVAAETGAAIGVFTAPSQSASGPALVQAKDVIKNEAGRGNWARTVYTTLGENVPAERLLAGETLTPPGNWSSFPPHKHDRPNPPQEAVLEEVYYFRVKPAQGYGLIWTYTAPEDPQGFSTVFVVEDGDTVLLPKGYHPVVASPGYQLHYTWVLAGEERRYGAWAEDPRHSWLKNA